jgi:hypothetical protein
VSARPVLYDDPVGYVLRPLTLWLRYWPQLAACYLLGLLGRRGAIELAAWAGHDNDFWASLIMPLAGMARLGLANRSTRLAGRGGSSASSGSARRSSRNIAT